MNVYVTIELVAIIFLFSVIWFSCPIFTLLICKAFCQLQQITMKPSLTGIRKSDFVELSIGIILTCGLIVQQIGHFLTMAPLLESFPKSAVYINVLFSWIITILFSVFIFILPAVLLLIWMNNFEEYFTHNNLHDHEVLLWVETSIIYYKYSLSQLIYQFSSFTIGFFPWILYFSSFVEAFSNTYIFSSMCHTLTWIKNYWELLRT